MSEADKPKKRFRGFWMPVELLQSPILTPQQRTIICYIGSLKTFYASDAHMAAAINIPLHTLQVQLCKLREKGLIIGRQLNPALKILWNSKATYQALSTTYHILSIPYHTLSPKADFTSENGALGTSSGASKGTMGTAIAVQYRFEDIKVRVEELIEQNDYRISDPETVIENIKADLESGKIRLEAIPERLRLISECRTTPKVPPAPLQRYGW